MLKKKIEIFLSKKSKKKFHVPIGLLDSLETNNLFNSILSYKSKWQSFLAGGGRNNNYNRLRLIFA